MIILYRVRRFLKMTLQMFTLLYNNETMKYNIYRNELCRHNLVAQNISRAKVVW